MNKYTIPTQKAQSVIEINGQKVFLKSSFADKMDFSVWIQKNQDKDDKWLLSEIIKKNLPKDLADLVLEKGSIEQIANIGSEIIANKLGISREEYLAKTSEVLTKKK